MIVSKLIPLVWLYLLVIVIISGFKGLKYDNARKEVEPKYNGNHSFTYKNGKIRFFLPLLISIKHTDPVLRKHAKIYNRMAIQFWFAVLIITILHIFNS